MVWGGREEGHCNRRAKWKVPMYGMQGPYLVCDVHAMGWKEWQPENVKALDDDTPWPRGRSSIVEKRR